MASRSSAPVRPRRSGWGSLFVWVVCIGLTAAALRNALASEPGLEALALETACAGPSAAPLPPASASGPSPGKAPAASPGKAPAASPVSPCRLQPTRWESGPLGRNMEFQRPGGGAPVRVECRREHIAIGDYRCTAAR